MWRPSRVAGGPLVWNIMYDNFLRKDLLAGTSIIGFADDALVVCAANGVKTLELRINDSLWRAKRWLDSRCLKMAPEKTEALMVTDRRSFKYPRIVLGEHKIEWKKSIKYLDVQLDRRLSFGEHLQTATAKAIQCGGALTQLMPNIGGPREAKRRLVASVVNSKRLYAAPIWTSALNNHAILKKLFSAQRGVVMRIVSVYRTVSTSTLLVLASVTQIDLLAEERKETFQLRRSSPAKQNCRKSLARRRSSARMEGADSSRNGRRDGMVTNPGGWHTVWSRSSPHDWIERTVKSAFTWRKHFRAMVALMRTWSASRKERMSRVATTVPLWKMQSTHSLSMPGGARKGRLSVGKWAHNSLLTQCSLSCFSLNRYRCLSSHSSPW